MTEVFDRAIADHVTLYLPPPISVNAMYRSFAMGKRLATIKSQKYRDWIREAGDMLEAQKPACVPGYYAIGIAVPAKTRVDIGNVEKAVSDLLQTHNVIENDRLCERIEIWRGAEDRMLVSIRKFERVA